MDATPGILYALIEAADDYYGAHTFDCFDKGGGAMYVVDGEAMVAFQRALHKARQLYVEMVEPKPVQGVLL